MIRQAFLKVKDIWHSKLNEHFGKLAAVWQLKYHQTNLVYLFRMFELLFKVSGLQWVTHVRVVTLNRYEVFVL